ncbi:hypothetical protein OKW48_001878 [Paraburkholderia youngii]
MVIESALTCLPKHTHWQYERIGDRKYIFNGLNI